MSPTLKSDEKSTTSSRKRNASSSASATPTKKSAPASTPSSKKPIIIVRFLKDYIRTPFPYLILVYIFVVTGSFILFNNIWHLYLFTFVWPRFAIPGFKGKQTSRNYRIFSKISRTRIQAVF